MARQDGKLKVLDIAGRWNRLGGEYGQNLFGDRLGDSVIIDGDTILRKRGPFQIATNFRLAVHPKPPWPEGEERYETVAGMLSQADHYSVDLFRRALDASHQEGYSPTIYSQVYELNTGTIHLYLYHDFEHEVILHLADELAKGPHVVALQDLFPSNSDLDRWAANQVYDWMAGYVERIDPRIPRDSQGWMSGQYEVLEQADTGPMKIYLEKDQLYMLRPNQLPIALYPTDPNTVFHHFLNGIDMTFTFRRNLWGQVTGAQGTFKFDPYSISLPYNLIRPGVASYNTSLWITIAVAGILLIVTASALVLRRRRKGTGQVR